MAGVFLSWRLNVALCFRFTCSARPTGAGLGERRAARGAKIARVRAARGVAGARGRACAGGGVRSALSRGQEARHVVACRSVGRGARQCAHAAREKRNGVGHVQGVAERRARLGVGSRRHEKRAGSTGRRGARRSSPQRRARCRATRLTCARKSARRRSFFSRKKQQHKHQSRYAARRAYARACSLTDV